MRDDDIAIVAMSGRFPGASHLGEFWSNLCNTKETISRFSESELLAAGETLATINSAEYVPAAATIDDATAFDHRFFGIGKREAINIDPQHRLLLEEAWNVLEIAGNGRRAEPSRVGVFAGCTRPSYGPPAASHVGVEGSDYIQATIDRGRDFLATRISYCLNLTGPSVTVQTACSTSLVAVHMACRSLLFGDCDTALAGGASIRFPQKSGYLYEAGGILSPDGHCRPFDANAGGTVPGSGVGVVLLRRLADAVDEDDDIIAVIKATGVNNDGRDKIGYTAPSIGGQADLITKVLEDAGVSADEVTLVEGHGTATLLGDPIEVAALLQAFGPQTERRQYCLLGSVKGNIGHLDAAAGIAGLIKAGLAIRHAIVPGTVHFRSPNPALDIENTPFCVSAETVGWPGAERRVAAVSSFGVGGTNAHVILEEPPARASGRRSTPRTSYLISMSARSEAALEAVEVRLADALERDEHIDLGAVAHTLSAGRTAFKHRSTLLASDPRTAALALRSRVAKRATTREQPQSAFIFAGQGVSLRGVALPADDHPEFAEELKRIAELMVPHLDFDPLDILLDDVGTAPQEVLDTRVAQPTLFTLELAIARVWQRWNVRPEAMLGHSVGEIVAACVSGVFSEEAAALFVAIRGELMQQTEPGAMTAVLLDETAIQSLLSDASDELSLAAINGSENCVVSGLLHEIVEFEERLAGSEVPFRRLQTNRAFHNSLIEPALATLRECLESLELNVPKVPFVSNVTGTWADDRVTTAEYWVKHARSPVRFADGVRTLLNRKIDVLLEIGPDRTLSRLVSSICRDGDVTIVASLDSPRAGLNDAAAEIWRAGVDLRMEEHGVPIVTLPTYPFERELAELDPRAIRGRLRRDGIHLHDVELSTPVWRRDRRPLAVREPLPGPYLFLGAECSIASRMMRALQMNGASAHAADISGLFAAGATAGDDAIEERLLDVLRTQWNGTAPRRVVYFCGLDGDADFDACFFTVIAVARALDTVFPGGPVRLDLVTGNVHDVVGADARAPWGAMAIAALMVAAQEYPHLTWGAVDVDTEADEQSLYDNLRAILQRPPLGGIAALRNGSLWEQRFVPIDSSADKPAMLRHGGVYLITGGLGGIGVALARHMFHAFGARLVIVGRGADDSHPVVRELRDLGADVLVVKGDVALVRDVRAAVDAALERFGCIHGVIHSAGLAGGGLIGTRTRGDMEAVLRPKVSGTRILAEVLDDLPLDFMCLCSSLTSVSGGIGTADYAAANAFLDAFAASRTARGRPTISVNWDAWRERGMAVDAEARRDAVLGPARHVASGLSDQEGSVAFESALTAGAAQVLVASGDLSERLSPEFAVDDIDDVIPERDGTAFTSGDSAEDADSVLIRQMKTVWCEVLGLDGVDIEDDFFALGGNSLLAMQVATRLRRRYNIALPLDAILRSTTIDRLANAAAAARQAQEVGEVMDGAQHTGQRRDEERNLGFQLLCFPWAGASELLYRQWADDLEPWIAIHPVPYPDRREAGQGRTFRMETFIERIVEEQRDSLNEPYLIFGHSFGALVAFEFARSIRRRSLPPPTHIFLSACGPPEAVANRQSLHELPDSELVIELGKLGGFESEVFSDHEFRTAYLTSLRVDLEVFGTYEYLPEPPLMTSLTVFGGEDDPSVDWRSLSHWRRQTRGDFVTRTYSGGHFFIHEHRTAVTREVVQTMKRAAEAR